VMPDYQSIFAIGDAAAVRWGPDRIVPGLAAAAEQMGHYVSHVTCRRLRRPLERALVTGRIQPIQT
jgi:NADH dehydrogenase FAD-containing subunit